MATTKRRLLPIVDRRFQFKYAGIIVAVAALASTALGYFLLSAYTEMNEMLAVLQLSVQDGDALGARMNADDAKRVFTLVIGFLVGEVVILGLLGLIITHRVCGPVFVLQRDLQTFVDGKYPSHRVLRSSDEFRGAFETFGAAMKQLQERDRAEVLVLDAALQQIGAGHSAAPALETLRDERKQRLAAATEFG
jgi:hypothetical protein